MSEEKPISEHLIELKWNKIGEFSHEGFERRHQVGFQPAVILPVGGAGNDFGADPEQMLAASLASCHMMTFLALASKKRLTVTSYQDSAVAELDKREDGKMYVRRIRLSPTATFEGEKQPDEATIEKMHHKAHDHCFVANSLSCDVVVTPQ
ncbi:MAG: OsmC family protein [Oceanobacter sp.]